MANLKRKLKRAKQREEVPEMPPVQELANQAQARNNPKDRGSYLMEQMDPDQQASMPPQKRQQQETINAALTEMIYREDTKGSIQKTLSQGPPEITIPAATNMVFKRFEDLTVESNGRMPLDMRLMGGVHTFNEIRDLTQAMGVLPKELSEEQERGLLTASIKKYIEAGLKDKSIDPIELQKEVEPLMSPEEHELGQMSAQEAGVPGELTQDQALRGMMDKKMMPLQVENQQLQKQNKQMTGALQGMPSTPPQQEGA